MGTLSGIRYQQNVVFSGAVSTSPITDTSDACRRIDYTRIIFNTTMATYCSPTDISEIIKLTGTRETLFGGGNESFTFSNEHRE
jgi:hypothetical protein